MGRRSLARKHKLVGQIDRAVHWSGESRQVDRLEASNRLLAQMIELERQGHDYHLVGHNRSGSIMWEALISAGKSHAQVLKGQTPICDAWHDSLSPA